MSVEVDEKVNQSKEMKKSAFVVGYTGECGKELVQALSKTKIFSKVVLIGRRKVEISPDPGPEFEQKVVNYDALDDHRDAFEGAEVGYCCLGTTRRIAGKEGFVKVDRDYLLKSAEIAKSTGCKHFSLISSTGADKNSFFLYPRIKGEVEDALQNMQFEKLSIFRPGLLMCDRTERRMGERCFQIMFKPFAYCFPTTGSVPTSTVGMAMVVDTVQHGDERFRMYNNAQIHGAAKIKITKD